MKTLETTKIPTEQLDALERFALSEAGPELRDVLLSLSRCVREGDEIVVIDGSRTLTPNQAAERLDMSRTHLYKLLDRGEIVFHRVGRDRRIRVHDLVEFEQQRQRDRRELAERFAHQRETAATATDEIADLL
ncbi:helix-turn-helix domain-containing protein [Phytoactinopolyspora alkaliphila]|uniref:Helix-turn-helix domain-containing protein n=1 Tax=Phytoactinopolyspora alkaliphila TaxID=1783498 RepID=A0A6N9YPZ1_9ACTN|nr:helix-turn-helix domain-containing protein [Phytoactinopolyspora alkaliphila]NED97121.1 helix-turn-helix domain-containing protein [Phytoactinopolyspora alkaliphila]